MGLFDLFKNKKQNEPAGISGESYFTTDADEKELAAFTHKAIDVFQNNPGFTQDQVVDAIRLFTHDEHLALALYRFIPIAYCRLLVPEPLYSDEYIVYKNGDDKNKFRFSEDRIYHTVYAISKTRFSTEPSQDKIVSILVHSADFNALNEALTRGSELKDLVFGPSYFM